MFSILKIAFLGPFLLALFATPWGKPILNTKLLEVCKGDEDFFIDELQQAHPQVVLGGLKILAFLEKLSKSYPRPKLYSLVRSGTQRVPIERATLTKRSLQSVPRGLSRTSVKIKGDLDPEEGVEDYLSRDTQSKFKTPLEYQLIAAGDEVQGITLPSMHVRMGKYAKEKMAGAFEFLSDTFRKIFFLSARLHVPYRHQYYSLSTGSQIGNYKRMEALDLPLRLWHTAYSEIFSLCEPLNAKKRREAIEDAYGARKLANKEWHKMEKESRMALKEECVEFLWSFVVKQSLLDKLVSIKSKLQSNSLTTAVHQLSQIFSGFRSHVSKVKKKKLSEAVENYLASKIASLRMPSSFGGDTLALTEHLLREEELAKIDASLYPRENLLPPPPAIFEARELFYKCSAHAAYTMNQTRKKWEAEYWALRYARPKQIEYSNGVVKINRLRKKWNEQADVYMLLTRVELMRNIMNRYLKVDVLPPEARKPKHQY
ncbi:hypothetical protein O181_000148 [Austropuccinia psidii MF-1]|uniref:Uncharacterized protein n=1 Tax=Austropuccinia psidii MF-1 TaxID=1389203 RepID=A0A9Q3GAM2_9BASI|nr:hypothetical protein [Austropuccinia psidii MF-1]